MSRCELSGKSPQIKNLVSHSNIKTKFLVQPNVQRKQVFSTALGRSVRLLVATSTIRHMEHVGGFDTYILNQPDQQLSRRALAVKRKIQGMLRARPASAKPAKKVAPVATPEVQAPAKAKSSAKAGKKAPKSKGTKS
jgi:large subunit ribosomal protein L28